MPEIGNPKRINHRIAFYLETGDKKGKQTSGNKKVITRPHLKNKEEFITNCGKADKLF